MPYDLALSEYGDLMFSASRDLLGVSGQALVEQRIRIRLKIPKASWIYDDDRTLGSFLHQLGGTPLDQATEQATTLVREALRAMEDVIVDHVDVEKDGNTGRLTVFYNFSDTETIDTTNDADVLSAQLSFEIPEGG